MKERQRRLQAVCRLVETNPAGSQDIILEMLKGEGFSLTQATLSRDLKSLGVCKRSNFEGGYKYYFPDEKERNEVRQKHIDDFLQGYISIEWSGNIVVIKTYSGHSNAVALAVDDLALDDVLGTIAGQDNTVFVCLRVGFNGENFMAVMKKHIPDIEA
jgi:transcriptional regulator of arginine metabolism